MKQSYKTPAAFRRALEARLRNQAQREGVDLQWLRRQVAFERLLARVFRSRESVWLLKGGYAMELRLQQQARTTLDIDLMIANTEALRLVTDAEPEEQTVDVAYDHLQEQASINLDDYFQYVIAAPKPIMAAPEGGFRCSVECRIDGRVFEIFHIDIGLGDLVLDEPEWVSCRNMELFAGRTMPQIPLLPATQQIAEKLHAYTFPWADRINTRVKDLVDLILLFEVSQPEKSALQDAVAKTFALRNTHSLPEQLSPPPIDWTTPFEPLAQQMALPVNTLDEGYDYLKDKWKDYELGIKPV